MGKDGDLRSRFRLSRRRGGVIFRYRRIGWVGVKIEKLEGRFD